jgi:PAS domain S-box-containing protein
VPLVLLVACQSKSALALTRRRLDDQQGLQYGRLGESVSVVHLLHPYDTNVMRESAITSSESDARYRALVEATPIPFFVVKSTTGQIVYANTHFGDLIGAPTDTLIGKRATDFLEDMSSRQSVILDLDKNGYFQSHEVQGTNAQGKEFWVSVSAQPTTFDGEPALLNALVDISDSKRAAEEVERLRRQNELILNSAGEAIYGLDLDGNITFVNRAAVAITGWNADELIGKSQHETFHHSRSDTSPLPREESPLQKAIEEGVQYQADNEVFWRKDGTGFPVEYVSTPIRDERGVLEGAVVVLRDITEHLEVQRARVMEAATAARSEELQRSRQRLVAVAESLRRDISSHLHGSVQNKLILVSHRLRSIIEKSTKGEIKAELKGLHRQLEDITENDVRLISQQLYPAILRRGLIPALQSLNDQFDTILDIDMQIDSSLAQKERADSHYVSEQVRLSTYRIAEASLTNVVKHSGAIAVTINLEEVTDGWFSLTVSDEGKGFDVDEISAGMGVGTMHDYAEVVGGDCTIKSRVNSGTQVRAMMPLREPVQQS